MNRILQENSKENAEDNAVDYSDDEDFEEEAMDSQDGELDKSKFNMIIIIILFQKLTRTETL